MESWSYVSGGKGFVSEESVSVDDGITPCSWSQQGVKNQQVGSEIRDAFGGEDESSSNHSNSTYSKDSSLIDLKLGRGRFLDAKNFNLSSTKRNRAGGLTSFCQVQGCGKDLTSCKDYHKRHKVCEIHSKTTKVIVNGIQQRFCQQCSRFHLLAEFDDGKRSCRKRLAGHNERRRKPHTGLHSGRAGKYFQPFSGKKKKKHPIFLSLGRCLTIKILQVYLITFNVSDDVSCHNIVINGFTYQQLLPRNTCFL